MFGDACNVSVADDMDHGVHKPNLTWREETENGKEAMKSRGEHVKPGL